MRSLREYSVKRQPKVEPWRTSASEWRWVIELNAEREDIWRDRNTVRGERRMKTKTGRAAPNVHAHSFHADLVFSSIMSILVSKQYDKSFPTPARPPPSQIFKLNFPSRTSLSSGCKRTGLITLWSKLNLQLEKRGWGLLSPLWHERRQGPAFCSCSTVLAPSKEPCWALLWTLFYF